MPSRFLTNVLLSLCCLSFFMGPEAVAQNEPATSAARTGYPAQWPAGPPATSVPQWAHPGAIRFARWDGGPIETAKGFLSGWPGMNPPLPDYVFTTTNWYEPGTVRFLRDGHFNLIWVTFSAGFSIPTEKVQRDLLRVYIEHCHHHGIHVMAYESVANIFWEDMYPKVPEAKNWVRIGSDGKPVPYGAANYGKMGRVTALHGRRDQSAVARSAEEADRPGGRGRHRRHHVRQLRSPLRGRAGRPVSRDHALLR